MDRDRRRPRIKIDIVPYLFVLPMVIVTVAFVIYPLLSNLFYSFQDAKLIKQGSDFIGLTNYREILFQRRIWMSINRTIIWTLINLVFMSIIGLVTALLFTTNFWGKSLMRAAILIPWVLPPVVTGYTWNLILSEDVGILPFLLKSMHLIPQDFAFFQAARPAMAAAIMANVWRAYPFFALMLYAKISTIPTDQIEAASLDGASSIQKFKYITMPYIQPVFSICLILAFLWTFNAYDILKVMTNGGPGEGTTTIPLLIAREAFDYYNLSRASTMSIITFAVMLVLIYIFKSIVGLMNRKGNN